MKLSTALSRALQALPMQPSDGATVELAKHYAAALDADPEKLWRMGPQFLETLTELGMTPKARNSVVKGGAVADGSDKLSEFRSRRERRAAHLDTASS